MDSRSPIYLYHITHVDNLVKILDCGGLWSYNQVLRTNVSYTNIAYNDLQQRRAKKQIPCGSKGTLHDYVPFFFGRLPPMLYTISRGNVPGYADGQEPLIYLVSRIDAVQQLNLPFVFSDGHGIMAYTEFFSDLADLERIDWDVMKAKYWHDTEEDDDRARRRQAEFLIYQECPWQAIRGIGAINQAMKARVEDIIRDVASIPVIERRDWYY